MASGDPHASDRAAIRSTLKWYATFLVGLGTALAGTLSFAILPDLGPRYIGWGALTGGLALLSILMGLVIVRDLLYLRPFHSGRLQEPAIKAALAPHLDDILPDDIQTVEEIAQRRTAEAAKPSPNLKELERLEAIGGRVRSAGSFLDLHRKIEAANRQLMGLFVAFCVLIALLVYVQALAKADKATDSDPTANMVPLQFSPGTGWADYAGAVAQTCKLDQNGVIGAMGTADSPYDGWWTIVLKGPHCAGVTIAVPAATISALP